MIALITVLHVLTAILLATVILMQSGRGGGLTQSFASAESMFGAKTNEFMVRATVILALVFLVTSLSLAWLNSKQERSLMEGVKASAPVSLPFKAGGPETNATAPEAAPAAAAPEAAQPAAAASGENTSASGTNAAAAPATQAAPAGTEKSAPAEGAAAPATAQ